MPRIKVDAEELDNFTRNLAPANLPPKKDRPVQEPVVRESAASPGPDPRIAGVPFGEDEEDDIPRVKVDESRPQRVAPLRTATEVVIPSINKGIIEGLTFLPNAATHGVAKGIYSSYLPLGPEGPELDEPRPFTLGTALKEAFELPQRIPDIQIGRGLGIQGLTIPQEAWRGFDATPRAPVTDKERQLAEMGYMGGMGLTFPIPLGFWKSFTSQLPLQSEAGEVARRALSSRYTSPEAFADVLLKYGKDYVLNPSLRKYGTEGFVGTLMGWGYALPHYWDDPQQEIRRELPGLGNVDVKPALQMLLGMAAPISVMVASPTQFAARIGENGKELLAHLYKKTISNLKRGVEGFTPQGKQDLAARIADALIEPESKRLLLEALDEGSFFPSETVPGNTQPVTVLPNGEVVPRAAGLNPDTLQWLKERGMDDMMLASLEETLAVNRPRILKQRQAEAERRREQFNNIYDELRVRLRGVDESEAYDFLDQARQKIIDLSNADLDSAKIEARRLYEELVPTIGEESAAIVVRDQLQGAHNAAHIKQKELWSPEALGVSTVDATNIGDWALQQIKNANKVGREYALPGMYYRLAGTTRLNSIGIGKTGEPITVRDIGAQVMDDVGIEFKPETIPLNGLLDEVVAPPGTVDPISAKPTTIQEVHDLRKVAGDKKARLNQSPAGDDNLARLYGEVQKFIDDEVLVESNIFKAEAGYSGRQKIQEAEGELAEVDSFIVERQKILDDAASTPEARTTAREEMEELTLVRSEFEGQLNRLRAAEDARVAGTEGEGIVPLAQQLEAFKTARAYTYWMHETFERSPGVGGILGYTRRGDRVIPAKTIKAILEPGVGGGSAIDSFRNAITVPVKRLDPDDGVTWTSPLEGTLRKGASLAEIEAGLLHRLALKSDTTDAKTVETFINRWKTTIDKFPGLEQRLKNYADTQAMVDDITFRMTTPSPAEIKAAMQRLSSSEEGTASLASGEISELVNLSRRRLMKALDDKRTDSNAFEYLDVDPRLAAQSYMKQDMSKMEARAAELHRALDLDDTGRAAAGFRTALWRTLKDMSSIVPEGSNVAEMVPTKLAENINTYRPFLQQFFDNTQMAFVDNLVEGVPLTRTGVREPLAGRLPEDIMQTGRGEAVLEVVGAGGRVAGQHIGQDLIALNTLSASYLGKRLAGRAWTKTGRAEIEAILEEAMRNPEVAALLLRRADNLEPILPPLLDRAVGKVRDNAYRAANSYREAHKIRKQEVREAYNRAYQDAIDRGATPETAKFEAGVASSEANLAANNKLASDLANVRQDMQDRGVQIAQKGLGATLRFIAPHLLGPIEKAITLGLLPASGHTISDTMLQEDWELGAPYTFKDNQRRAAIEQSLRDQAAEQTSLVAPQSIARPVAASSLSPVVAPAQPPVVAPAQPPVPAAPDPSIQERGEALFPNDPIFAPSLMNKGGIASVKKKPKQMVY